MVKNFIGSCVAAAAALYFIDFVAKHAETLSTILFK